MKNNLSSVMCFILFIVLTGCANKEFSEILRDDQIETIVHKEVVDNGVVIFYVPNREGEDSAKVDFEARFIQKNLFGWKATYDRGGTTATLDTNLYSQYLMKNSDKSPFPLLFGEITTPKITTVKIEYGNETKIKEAKIVENKGKKFWFAFIEEPKEKIKYTIKGYSKSGQVIEKAEQEAG
ncbi:hypothetical protein HNQ94_000072 [Salirhabdus euzebyi]|uniref:Lipoprotein n=1 Tax=Salirhabdus euzebyi TaxID=394506 RepID=A0A841PXX3_9BACI|nr:hypothetical protein [Salirhabdus euzebyi]MBB6451651.1 hypothetical protein [Salirhabdus euzebyi]